MRKSTLFFIVSLFISFILNAQVKEVNVEWKSIKNSEGKIKLDEVKVWGGNVNSKYEAFKYPTDICRDSRGNYYIADSGENEIVVFDRDGKYIKKIGRTGAGPGDLKYPYSIAIDSRDNLLVSEEGNGRVQIFNNGKSQIIMNPVSTEFIILRLDKSGRMVLKNNSIVNGSSLLNLFDYKKKITGQIGSFSFDSKKKGAAVYFAKSFGFSTDDEGNYYIGYLFHNNVIEKYSPSGKIIMKLNYQLSMPNGELKEMVREGGSAIISDGKPEPVSVDAAGDGTIFLLIRKRELEKGESKYFPGFMSTTDGNTTEMKVIQPKERKNKFDLFAVVIFDKNGNLLGMKSLDYFADRIRVINNDVFITNSYLESVIHQYKFSK